MANGTGNKRTVTIIIATVLLLCAYGAYTMPDLRTVREQIDSAIRDLDKIPDTITR